MVAKLSEGDTIAMQGEVTLVHDDGTVTVWLHGYGVPITTTGEHLSLVILLRLLWSGSTIVCEGSGSTINSNVTSRPVEIFAGTLRIKVRDERKFRCDCL